MMVAQWTRTKKGFVGDGMWWLGIMAEMDSDLSVLGALPRRHSRRPNWLRQLD